MSEKRYQPDSVENYIIEILGKHGVPIESAKATAWALVQADLSGTFSHGINSLDTIIVPSIKNKWAKPDAPLKNVTRDVEGLLAAQALDAQGGLGHYAALEAVELGKKLARMYGISEVSVANVGHFGAAGVYAREIAKEGDLIGIVTCTTPDFMIPYGGVNKAVGTNPIAIAIPYNRNGDTADYDAATTIRAASGTYKALEEHHEKLPFLVIGPDGKPTTDPNVFDYSPSNFSKIGAMLPVGHSDGVGYKGSGLAIMIDLLNVIGASLSGHRSSSLEERTATIEHTCTCKRIDVRYGLAEAHKRIQDRMNSIKEKAGGDMKLPGEKEAKNRESYSVDGIPYTPESIVRLNKLGDVVGLEPIKPWIR